MARSACRPGPMRAPLILFLALALGGCATTLSVQPVSQASLDAVQADRGAVVLFQIKATLDGRPLSLANPGYDTSLDNFFRIYLARLDEPQAPARIRPASPSEAASSEGWHYLVLPAGVYYLLVLPPGTEGGNVIYNASTAKFGHNPRGIDVSDRAQGAISMSPELMAWVWLKDVPPAGFTELPGFWFEVPEKRQAVYLGSLSVACSTRRGLLGSLLGACNDPRWSDDSQSARQVIASILPQEVVHVSPLVPNGKRQPGTLAGPLHSIDVAVRSPNGLGLSLRGAAEARQETTAATKASLFGGLDASLSLVQPSDLADLPLAVLLYPVAAAVEQGARADAEQRLASAQACMDRLSGEVRKFDYSGAFAEALRSAAGSLRSGPHQVTNGAGLRLAASLSVLRLREVVPRQVALELALQVRLETAEPPSTRYYAVIYYGHPSLSNPLASGLSLLYAQVLSERPRLRPIEEWCSPDGGSLLADEIAAAMTKMAAPVARALE